MRTSNAGPWDMAIKISASVTAGSSGRDPNQTRPARQASNASVIRISDLFIDFFMPPSESPQIVAAVKPRKTETGVKLAICDSLSLAIVLLRLVRESCALVTVWLIPVVRSFSMPRSNSPGERPALHIVVCCFQQFGVVVPAMISAPFGLPAIVFWIYVCASLLFIIGLIKIFGELSQLHGVDKIMPFGRLFFAVPMAVFGSEHFTATANVAALVPRWIPAHTFWVYLVGVAFLCAALSIAVLVQARLAAALVGMTLLIFVFVMDLPAAVANPGNRFFWALALRELAFSGGAFAFAMSPLPGQPSSARPTAALAAIPRFFVGITSLFYGVEHLLHPEYVPGVPLQKLTPDWIPGRMFLSYFVGVILILAGVCLLVNKKARMAATSLGLAILLTVLWIYLPMLLAAPTDVVALNFFFDTLLFCGAILLLANATDKETASPPN